MKSLIIGVALGTTVGVAIGMAVKTMQDQGLLDQWADQLHSFSSKIKKDTKNLIAKGKNEAEYVKEQVEYSAGLNKEDLN